MIDLKFPDGAVRQYPDGSTGRDVAQAISPSLAKKALLAELNGEQRDMSRVLETGGDFRLIMRDDPEALYTIRHDTAHVLAEAVQTLFPGTQVTIGPAIDDGFYYDFFREEPFSTDDFAAIEKQMAKIVDRDSKFEREVWERADAIKFFEDRGEKFKAELIRDLPGTETITLYKQGDWIDLCRGPHFPSTRHVGKAFKLTKLAGAYWRGDSNREQLQRIYGTAWASKEDLDAYLLRLEEAEKRDHRKVGKAMELFHMQEEGRGMVFWHPKGWVLWRVL
ncbi:MAG: TGS domain-containing protein, partial [Brevundimonas sp.]